MTSPLFSGTEVYVPGVGNCTLALPLWLLGRHARKLPFKAWKDLDAADFAAMADLIEDCLRLNYPALPADPLTDIPYANFVELWGVLVRLMERLDFTARAATPAG